MEVVDELLQLIADLIVRRANGDFGSQVPFGDALEAGPPDYRNKSGSPSGRASDRHFHHDN